MFDALYTTINSNIQVVYNQNITQHQKYISSDEIKIKNLINEIKKISKYEIEEYKFEKIDDEITALGIKLKNFPLNKNRVAYSIELMNKLDKNLPEDIDIFVV